MQYVASGDDMSDVILGICYSLCETPTAAT